jgi:hypothetical protein
MSVQNYDVFLVASLTLLFSISLVSVSLAYIFRPTPKAERSEYQSNHIYRK